MLSLKRTTDGLSKVSELGEERTTSPLRDAEGTRKEESTRVYRVIFHDDVPVLAANVCRRRLLLCKPCVKKCAIEHKGRVRHCAGDHSELFPLTALTIYRIQVHLDTLKLENSLSGKLSGQDSKGATRFSGGVSAERHSPPEPVKTEKHNKSAIHGLVSGRSCYLRAKLGRKLLHNDKCVYPSISPQ